MMRKKIILLPLLLSIFMIGAVSASNNTDDGVLGHTDDGCSVVEKSHNTNEKFNANNPVIRKKHNNDLFNKDIIKSNRDENKLLSNDKVKVKAQRIGTKYKNTRIIARFAYSNGSAFANSKVRINAFESDSAEVYYDYKSQKKILKTDKNGWINYNLHWMPTTWDIDFYSWDKDHREWNYIGTKFDFKIGYLGAKIKAPSKISIPHKSKKKIAIKVMDKNNKPLKNVKVTFSVGEKEKATLKTNSKGYVYFKTNKLKIGDYKAKFDLRYEPIYEAHNKYTSIDLYKILTVYPKMDKNIIKRIDEYKIEVLKWKTDIYHELDVSIEKKGEENLLDLNKYQVKIYYKEKGKNKSTKWEHGDRQIATYFKYRLDPKVKITKIKIKF